MMSTAEKAHAARVLEDEICQACEKLERVSLFYQIAAQDVYDAHKIAVGKSEVIHGETALIVLANDLKELGLLVESLGDYALGALTLLQKTADLR